jgi:hypothetical protein
MPTSIAAGGNVAALAPIFAENRLPLFGIML